MYIGTSLSFLFSSDYYEHIHTYNLTDNIRVLHTHTHTYEHLFYNHCQCRVDIFFFMFLFFCQISLVYVVCTNCIIIVQIVLLL